MTVLSAQSIRRVRPVSPFCERTIFAGMTYGLGPAGYDIRCRENCLVGPGLTVLASSLERFDMPTDLIGFVTDKSSWARRGIAMQNTIIEPGWRGFLTLEVSNHSGRPIEIGAGVPIAQIIFLRLDEQTELPYSGKYQDQEPHPVVAIEEPS